ncbi:TPA: hypothetical protein EYN98_07005 [Candidatus Poribacteria bacterium]|nr:hypothetical protein [Candidatus Poribacteria bacterium]HIN29204.1 hypothetical protein [Candidatus Poribacteria bacterium]HIO79609.1 hypothetical protein [Candidatus Poribacteria bacterium]
MNVNLQPQFGIVKQYGSRASDQSLENFRANLKVGDSVSGRVLRQVAGNRFLVAFDGLNLVVETNIELNPQDSVQGRVLSLDEHVTVRLTSHSTNVTNRSKSIAELLESLNFSVDAQAKALAKSLVAYNIPLNAENLESLLNYASAFDIESNLSPNLITTAWLLKLPPQSHLISALQLVFEQRRSFVNELQHLKNSLDLLLKNLPKGINSSLINQILQFVSLNPNDADFADQISQFMNQLGLGYEAKLLALLNSPESIQEFSKNTNRNLKVLLLRLNLQVKDSLAENGLRNAVRRNLSQTIEAIEQVFASIDSHEIARNRDIINGGQFYLQIPLDYDDKHLTAEILGRSDSSDEIDLENFQLQMVIETENLGTLKVNLHVLHRDMICAILTEDLSYNSFIEREKGNLLSRMKALNYNLEDIHLQVVDKGKIGIDMIPITAASQSDLVRVDVSA